MHLQSETSPNLEAAWNCVKRDWAWQWFEPFYPDVAEVIESDREGWFEYVRSRLQNGEYRITPTTNREHFSCSHNLKLRAPTYAQPADQLLFTGAVLEATPAILRAGAHHPEVCGPVFFTDELGTQWPTDAGFWFQMLEARTRARIEEGAAYVATTDVSSFFGSVRHDVLTEELLAAGAPQTEVERIGTLLSAWFPSGRGLTWSRASHVLGSFYLAPVDRALNEAGIAFLRMVDDYRFFGRSRAETERALECFKSELERRGLAYNDAKTKVYSADGFVSRSSLLAVHRMAARALTKSIARMEGTALTAIAGRLRSFAEKSLRDEYRRYLGRLLAETPNLGAYLSAIVTERIPAAYVEFPVSELSDREQVHIEPDAIRCLSSVALSDDRPIGLRSVARKLLVACAQRQDVVVNLDATDHTIDSLADSLGFRGNSEFLQIEGVMFARLLDGSVRDAVMRELRPCGYLVQRALRQAR